MIDHRFFFKPNLGFAKDEFFFYSAEFGVLIGPV